MTQQENQAVATAPQAAKGNTQLSPANQLKNLLNNGAIKAQFENALKQNASIFMAAVLELFSTDNKLQQCNPELVVKEALKAAVLRLPINKALGQAFIIPYRVTKEDEKGKKYKVMEPSFQIGYKGLYQLAMRTGQYRIINADVVYEGELKKKSKLTGEIDLDGVKTSDTVIGYFAYIELLNGYHKALYMSVEEIATHAKRYSKALIYAEGVTVQSLMELSKLPVVADSGSLGWLGNFHGMAIKTVLRNLLSKYGYLSVELQQALDSDESGETKKALPETQTQAAITSQHQPIEIANVDYEDVTGAEIEDAESEELETDINPGF